MSFSHAEAWLKALEDVRANGVRTSPRGQETRELTWVQLSVIDPMTFPIETHGRKFRDVIGVLEGLSLVGEFNVHEMFTDRVAKFGHFMDGGVLWGAYGQRAHGTMAGAMSVLSRDPDSRQAVVTFFDSDRDLDRDKKDIPCTISAQFLLRDGALDLGISMRSNDLWLGTPYDFTQFSILQASMAQALKVKVGHYVHRVGSLHLYERDVDKSKPVAWSRSLPMPFPLWSPAVIDSYVGLDRAMAIQRRARRLALDRGFIPTTDFERWAYSLLHDIE